MKLFLGYLGAAALAVIGALCLAWPERVRDFYLDSYRRALSTLTRHDLSPLLRRFPGAGFFRLYGLFALISAAAIIWALLRG